MAANSARTVLFYGFPDRADLNAGEGLLTIRSGKFGESRQLPLHGSVLQALAGDAGLRDSACRQPATPAFSSRSPGHG